VFWIPTLYSIVFWNFVKTLISLLVFREIEEALIQFLNFHQLQNIGIQGNEDLKHQYVLAIINQNQYTNNIIDQYPDDKIQVLHDIIISIHMSIVSTFALNFGRQSCVNPGRKMKIYKRIRNFGSSCFLSNTFLPYNHSNCNDVACVTCVTHRNVFEYIFLPISNLPLPNIIAQLDPSTGVKEFTRMLLNLSLQTTLGRFGFINGYLTERRNRIVSENEE